MLCILLLSERLIWSNTSVVSCCQLTIWAQTQHECQGGHQQGGVHPPRREDAGRCASEEEDEKEDPLPGNWWSRRLHDLYLPLRSEGFSSIFPSRHTLMSTLAFKLPITWNANWIYHWAVGQSFLNAFDFAWNWTAFQQTSNLCA